jgi:hypothetical protein
LLVENVDDDDDGGGEREVDETGRGNGFSVIEFLLLLSGDDEDVCCDGERKVESILLSSRSESKSFT